VENFRPGVMDSFGLSYDVLREARPGLIMTSISNFGQTGPYRDLRASELVAFGLGGSLNGMGLPDREPIKLGANHVQYQAGNSAAYVSLAAWYGQRYADTPGQFIDVSLMETQAETINFRKIYLLASQYRGERGRRMEVTAIGFPSGYYPCSDGYVTVNGGGPFWPRTCALLGHPEWAQEERWGMAGGQFRPEAKQEFENEVWLPWVLSRTKVEVMEQCQKFGILAGAIMTVEDAMSSAHYRARDYFIDIEHPVAGTFAYPGAQFIMSRTPRQPPEPAPTLGQHNRDVLVGELGYTPAQLALLAPSATI
jgi:crotonobetainyl-CoA:carnitine CoA-transferase CaiB-like acyl-CoA transferase